MMQEINFIYMSTLVRASLSPREREETFRLPLLFSPSFRFSPPFSGPRTSISFLLELLALLLLSRTPIGVMSVICLPRPPDGGRVLMEGPSHPPLRNWRHHPSRLPSSAEPQSCRHLLRGTQSPLSLAQQLSPCSTTCFAISPPTL